MCGENTAGLVVPRSAAGSSPRVRGKLCSIKRILAGRRLIPACAGKTMRVQDIISGKGAHPRVCGENINGLIQGIKNMGSSPRVRGKRLTRVWLARASGLIPRVCGENRLANGGRYSRRGSSPRVRGKPTRGTMRASRVGLIPACAGKTASAPYLCNFWGAHPRVCGENTLNHGLSSSVLGSSPRVRGKRNRRFCRLNGRRLIPACAGKTLSQSAWINL